MDARITLALTDPAFPGMEEARRCQWLSRHPAVTVITYEELAGPTHGGTTEARQGAVTRLLDATGHPPRALDLAAPHNHDGDDLKVGVWRRYFTSDHERILAQHYSNLLTARPPCDAAARPA